MLAGCSGSGPTPASGPFTGTWSGANGVNVANFDTWTLSQAGSTVTGTVKTISSQGTASDDINGTASGNIATVSLSNNGKVEVGAATLTLSGTNLTAQWSGNSGAVTEALTAGGACANPLVGTLNILNTYYIEQKSDMYIMIFNGAGAPVLQGYNQLVQDILSGPYVAKTYGRTSTGSINTDDSWNLCTSSVIQVAACRVNQYTSNTGCKGRVAPHG